MTRRTALLLMAGLALAGVVALLIALPRRTQTPAPAGLQEAARRDLDLRSGVLYRHGQTEPYTGLLVERFPDHTRKVAIEIRGGRAEGVSQGWYENGKREVEEHFQAGISHGVRTRWHPDGSKKSEEQIEHGVLAGPYGEWHPSGQKAVAMTMLAGAPEGLAEAWYPDGQPQSRTHFHAGKMVDRQFFPRTLATATAAEPVPQHP